MKKKREKKQSREKTQAYKTFQDEMFFVGIKNNLITVAIILIYVLLFLGASVSKMGLMILFATISVLIFQFFVAPFTNASYTRNISNLLIIWKEGNLDQEKTTNLLIEILRCPKIIMYFIFLLFGLASLLFIILTYFFIEISHLQLVFLFTVTIFSSYVAGIIALYTSEFITQKYAIAIFESNIDFELLKSKKYYGVSLKIQFLLFVIIPVFFIGILIFIYFLKQHHILVEQNILQIAKTLVFFIINTIVLMSLFLIFRNNSILEIGKVQYLLEWLSVTDFKFEREIPVFLNNELSYITFLLKNTIKRFPKILDFHSLLSSEMYEHSFLLESYFFEQETLNQTNQRITRDFKDTLSLLKNISETFFEDIHSIFDLHSQLASILDETNEHINEAKKNANSLELENIEIHRSIKNLENQLHSISEVTSLLTDIADQTKIIAFNAELEAIKAGSEGENFLIIAAEIRRLADYTMDSIIETKDQITLIQETTRKLIGNMHNGIELTKRNKNLINKKEELLYTVKIQLETENLDLKNIENNKYKQEDGHEKMKYLLEQLSSVFNEYNMHSYDIENYIASIKRIAETLSKGEV